jgi:hypothetical protein
MRAGRTFWAVGLAVSGVLVAACSGTDTGSTPQTGGTAGNAGQAGGSGGAAGTGGTLGGTPDELGWPNVSAPEPAFTSRLSAWPW